MHRYLRSALLLCAVVAAAAAAFAQAAAVIPIALAPNMVPICSEPACVVNGTTASNIVFQFGTGTAWGNLISGATGNGLHFPLVVDCVNDAIDCATLGGDPDPAVRTETLMAQQQATPYTVSFTLAGVAQTPITVAPIGTATLSSSSGPLVSIVVPVAPGTVYTIGFSDVSFIPGQSGGWTFSCGEPVVTTAP